MRYISGSAVPPGKYPQSAIARLVRTTDLVPGTAAPSASMYVSNRGGGIRRLIGSAHRHVIGVRRDPQMDYGQPVEGIAEGPAMMRVATDPDIIFYQTQPFRIQLPVNGKLVSWIADLAYVTWDGSVWVREVKRTIADLADLEYEAKLQAVKWLLEGLGWNFRPWTLDEIRGSPARQKNTGIIYFDRAARLDGLMERFEEISAATDVTTYGDLIRDLDSANVNRARAAVHRLIMRGRVWADLDRLLEDWSEVRLRPASTAVWDLPFA